MMKHRILIFLLLILLTSCNQDLRIPDNIDNKFTKKHIRTKGSKVFIIPPKDFQPKVDIYGFEYDDSTGILIADIPGGQFWESKLRFDSLELINNDVMVYEFDKFKFQGFDCQLTHLQVSDKLNLFMMIFGDISFVTSISGYYPKNNKKMGKQIKKSILSTYYQNDLKLDPFETANFTYNDTISTFSYTGGGFNSYIFISETLKSYLTKSNFLITQLENNLSLKNKKDTIDYYINRLQNLTTDGRLKFKDINILDTNQIIIDGNRTIELIASAKNPTTYESCILYEAILFTERNEYNFDGVLYGNTEEGLKEISNLLSTFKEK